MDDLTVRILLFFFDIIGPISLGYWLKRQGLVSKTFTDKMIKVNVRVVFTILAFISFWKLPFSKDTAILPVLGILVLLFPYLIGMLMTRKNPDPLERGSLVLSAMLGNTGSIGGLVSYLIIGPVAFAYVQLAGIIQNFVVILFCFPMCQKFHDQAVSKGGPKRKRSFREIFLTWNQVSLLGMIAGAGLSLGGIEQPESLSPVFGALIQISTWVQLIPVGLLLNFGEARAAMKKVLVIIPIKFVVVPVFIWLIGLVFISSPEMTASLVIMSSCPTAINAVLTSALYGLKTDITMSSFVSTTILFAAVVCPALFILFA